MTIYPFMYRYMDASWLWYQRGSSAPRVFYNYTTGMVENHP